MGNDLIVIGQIAQSESDEEDFDDEELDDEDDGEGYINLSDMLDMNHDEPAPSNNKQSASKKRKIDELFNDDEDGDDEDENDDDDMDDDHIDDVKHASLLKAVTGTSEPSKKKRRVLAEQTSARSEGEFNLQGAEISDNQARDQLSLSHLVRALEPKGAGGVYARMREVSQQLQRADTSQLTRVTAPPQNNVARSRVQREVAFDVVKEQLDEWTNTVQSLRRAPSLDFTKSDGTFDGVGASKAILHRHSHNLTALVNNSALATAKRVMTNDPKTGNKDGSIDLEEEVRAIMAESLRAPSEGETVLGEEEDSDNDLHHRPVDLEQIKAHQAELAKMRSAMFFQEKKLKRLARIKSKKYRKILKKAKERKQMTLEEMRELDPEAAAEEEDKLDRQRALERVTLKHKQASKWAQHARHSANPLMKKDLEEHYRLGQELKKKIRGDQGSDSDSSAESYEQHEASDDELEQIEQEMDKHNKTAPTGLMAMRFMQRGAERQAEEARDLIRQIRDEERGHKRKLEAKARKLHGDDDEMNADSDDDAPNNRAEEDSDSESEVQEEPATVQGRRGFTRPRGAEQLRDHAEGDEVDLIGDSHQTHDVMLGSAFTSEFDPSQNRKQGVSSVDKKREHLFNVNSKSPLQAPAKSGKNTKTEAKNIIQFEPVDERSVRVKVNADKFSKGVAPVLVGDEEAEPFEATSDDDGIISLNSKAKSGSATKSKTNKRSSDVSNPWISQKQDDDAPVTKNSAKKENKLQISEAMNTIAGKDATEGEKKKKKQTKKKMTKIALDSDEEAETNSFDENNEPENLLASRDKRQQELISRAFETDDVEEQFYKEKEAQIREELPDHVKDESLKIEFMPGWGSWSGAGIDESKKKMTRRQKNLLATRDAEEEKARDQRVDKNLKHVIISGRQDKKTVKYQVAQQPFPYQSRDVYEKAMRHPIGKEWNPQETFKKMVEPKVKTKAGVIIAPITRKIKPL
jgi:U3 small nucleolar RNA-associated protein 14